MRVCLNVCSYEHLGERRVAGFVFIMRHQGFPKMTVDNDTLQYGCLINICSFLFARNMS
jgi:hypothetical protein